eukprot:6208107-Pleurochrysis_carterae.AAC.2
MAPSHAQTLSTLRRSSVRPKRPVLRERRAPHYSQGTHRRRGRLRSVAEARDLASPQARASSCFRAPVPQKSVILM